MLKTLNLDNWEQTVAKWLEEDVLTVDFFLQAGLVIFALAVGWVIRELFRKKQSEWIEGLHLPYRFKLILTNICRLVMQITALIVIMAGSAVLASDLAGNKDVGFSDAVMSLLMAWIVIRLVLQFIENAVIRNLFATAIWSVAALAILGVLDETTATLDSVGFNLGDFRLSALTVIKGMMALFILLYFAMFLSTLLERRVLAIKGLTISSKVLITKIMRVVLITSALLIGVTSAGVDLSLFAVFGGAVGLGVGFGLQKGISNLFSGMLLLMDQSIKPGDVIELPGVGGESTFGWVEQMGARYTEVVTRDNKSYLIPNEDFITQQVVNWSHGSTLIRLEVKFGVSYNSDPHEVKAVAEKASAEAHERICKDPAPICHLAEFADSSLNFKLRFWIKDAEKGVTNMRGAVMLALWDAFQENNINIPYPHREVYIHEAKDTAPRPKKKAAKKAASKPDDDKKDQAA